MTNYERITVRVFTVLFTVPAIRSVYFTQKTHQGISRRRGTVAVSGTLMRSYLRGSHTRRGHHPRLIRAIIFAAIIAP